MRDKWTDDRMTARARERKRGRGRQKEERRRGGLEFLRTSESLPTTNYLSLGGRAGLILGTVLISSSRRERRSRDCEKKMINVQTKTFIFPPFCGTS